MNDDTDRARLPDLNQVTKGLVEHFLACLDYKPPHTPSTDHLRKAVHRRATQMKISLGSDPISKMQFDTAVSVAAVWSPVPHLTRLDS
ncbi:hypothetical protein HII31_05440 [Pseudocercospora fuligena]|uniref:Uncharacterized protein n=1 Tax=Pseudocercospora fuligena TaxID=685502 RepID=A0A8H6VM62_9PEZI|nr:hypothetical protein HII31_05440 [Pseudocercospora fuligena]